MMRYNILFLIVLTLFGCGSSPPVTHDAPRDPEAVFQALATAGRMPTLHDFPFTLE